MPADDQRTTTKLTVKIQNKMFTDFSEQLSRLTLRRDAHLDRMISQEIPRLRADLEGKRLSGAANRFIAQKLNEMDVRPFSIAITQETARALKEAVEEHNLVRDAFLNRLIAMLRSTESFLKELGLEEYSEAKVPLSPIRLLEEAMTDPFYYLRRQCMDGEGLYLLKTPRYVGFSCYLEDRDVPGTDAWKEQRAIENEEMPL